MKTFPVSFGAGVFSGRYNEIDISEAKTAVNIALEHGINFFDTSPYYNNSEFILGESLWELRKKWPRESYYLCTKCGAYGTDVDRYFDFSAERVKKSVLESLWRLKTDYLDVVLCHDVEFDKDRQVIMQALPQLSELKNEGIIRYVGISGYPLDVLLDIARQQYEKNRPLDVILTYTHYSLHDHSLENYLQSYRDLGVQYVFNASPLSMGLLRDTRPAPSWHPASEELSRAADRWREVCAKRNQSLAKLALYHALSYKDTDTTIVGCSNPGEVRAAVEAATSKLSYEESSTLLEVLEAFREVQKYSWESGS